MNVVHIMTGAAESIKKWYSNWAAPVDGGGGGGGGEGRVAYHTSPDQSSHNGRTLIRTMIAVKNCRRDGALIFFFICAHAALSLKKWYGVRRTSRTVYAALE